METVEFSINDIKLKAFKNDCLYQTIERTGVWEPHMTTFIELFNEKFKIRSSIDVGANFGYHTIYLAQNSSNDVYAFEPQFQNFCLLSENTKNFPNIAIFNNACGDVIETVHMPYITNKTNIINMGDFTPNHAIDIGCTQVKTCIIDDMNLNDVDFIKIDVQGWEKKVLLGLERTIGKCKPLMIVEFEHFQLSKTGESCETLFKYIRSLGYHIYMLDYKYPSDHICVHNDKLSEFKTQFQNFIKPHTEFNDINANINYGVNEKISLEI